MQRHNYLEARRNCEDPYLVPGLNHPCNGMYRDEVSASGEEDSTRDTASFNGFVDNGHTNSPVIA